jgi:hypothetical protein
MSDLSTSPPEEEEAAAAAAAAADEVVMEGMTLNLFWGHEYRQGQKWKMMYTYMYMNIYLGDRKLCLFLYLWVEEEEEECVLDPAPIFPLGEGKVAKLCGQAWRGKKCENDQAHFFLRITERQEGGP